jgi:hypothetical protein
MGYTMNFDKRITNCKYIKFSDGSDKKYIQATINDVVSSVPLDEANVDYAQIKRQVDAGELTIEDAD